MFVLFVLFPPQRTFYRMAYHLFHLQLICSYVFWPLAVIMGVEFEDAIKVGSLLGTKVFVDEFVSFKQLGKMVENGEIQVSRVNYRIKDDHSWKGRVNPNGSEGHLIRVGYLLIKF